MRKAIIIILCLSPLLSFAQVITKIESVQSLYIELYRDNRLLGSATGFVIKSKTQNYLVTNWHVVTNKNPINKQWLDTVKISPNRIVIVHNAKTLGEYVIRDEKLLDKNDNPLWHENKIKNEMVDVVEIPLKDTNDITIYPVPYNNSVDTTILFQPTNRIFILGFPLAMHSLPFMPIWKTGTIASEPDIDQESKPIIWIDASTFPGMSGSPVYFMKNDYITKSGSSIKQFGQSMSVFIGVFSHENKGVIGALWKAQYLRKLFNALP
jgi:V8-like Glu-specific endopeptidase